MTDESLICPGCGSSAYYRYGRAKNGKQRRLCLICNRQYVIERTVVIHPSIRPQCPVCGEPMHIYMRQARATRYRCRNYPECKQYVKVENEKRK
jgi:hypothetical protein